MSPASLTAQTAAAAHVSRRRLLHLALAFGIAAPLLSLEGCGGGKSTFGTPFATPTPGSGPLPVGSAAFRAVAIASVQALAGGRAYPFAALKLVAPANSALHPARAQKAAALPTKQTRQVPTERVYDDVLKLYKLYTTSNNNLTVAYSTDAAGAVSAGSATVTIEGASDFDADYPSYPVAIQFNASVTEGTVPVSGSGTIVFSDDRGRNTLSGSFTLPHNDIKLSGALTLDDSFDVGGTMDIVENGTTLHLTQVSGNLDDSLTSPITCEPYGWTGTGSFNLQTGAFSITLDTGTGNSTATSDTTGNLVLRFADGTTQTVTSPLTAFLGGDPRQPSPTPTPSASPTPTPAPSNSSYTAPIPFDASPYAINNAGQILATARIGNDFDARPVFFASASAPQVVLSGGTNGGSGADPSVLTMNDKAQIFQVPAVGDSLYWSSPTANPVPFSAPASGSPEPAAINNRGTVVGAVSTNSASNSTATYWSDPATFMDLIVPVLPGSSQTFQYVNALAISPNGQIVGSATSLANPLLYWSAAAAQPQRLEVPNSFPAGAVVARMGINDRGQIFATVQVHQGIGNNSYVYFWSSPTAGGQLLPTLQNDNQGFAYGINASGIIVGYSDIGNDVSDRFVNAAVFWKDGQVTNLNTLIPPGLDWFLDQATAINDQGEIVGKGTIHLTGNSPLPQGFLLQPR